MALRRRWEVMDKTITFPDDDLLEGPWYMEFSDDEDNNDSNSRPPPPTPPPGQVSESKKIEGHGRGANLTESRDSGNFTEASLETSSEVSSSSCVSDTCSSCGRVLQREAEEKGVATVINHRTSETPTNRRKNSKSGTVKCQKSPQTDSKKCERCRNNPGGKDSGDPYSDWVVASSSVGTCGCGRRRSTSGILDEEGQALLGILEFPSNVSSIC